MNQDLQNESQTSEAGQDTQKNLETVDSESGVARNLRNFMSHSKTVSVEGIESTYKRPPSQGGTNDSYSRGEAKSIDRKKESHRGYGMPLTREPRSAAS